MVSLGRRARSATATVTRRPTTDDRRGSAYTSPRDPISDARTHAPSDSPREILLENASGKDNAQEFEDIRHSQAARDKAKEFFVGMLEGHESTKFPRDGEFVIPGHSGKSFATKNDEESRPTGTDSDYTWLIVGGALAAVAGAVWYFAQEAKKQQR